MASVDVERLLYGWASGHVDITALVSQRIYTVLPDSKTFPLLRFVLIDEQGLSEPILYLTSSLIQWEAYGGSKTQARAIADAFREAVSDDLPGEYALGVITGARHVSFGYLPDPDLDPNKPRYVGTVEIFAHPTSSQVS